MENQIVNTIMEQISFKQLLLFYRFKFVKLNDNSLRLHYKHRNLDIIYNEGLDLYNIEKHIIKGIGEWKTEKIEGIYFDSLKEIIEEFFNIKYLGGVKNEIY